MSKKQKGKLTGEKWTEYGLCAIILTATPLGWLSYLFGILGIAFGTIAVWKGAIRKGIIVIIVSLILLLFFPSFWVSFGF